MADPRSLRLIFEYDGDHVDLVSRQPVDMVAPASAPLGDFSERAGSWLEVQDQEGAVLHRQVLHDPLRNAGSEVFSPDPDESLRRVDRTRSSGAFTVVVPDLPGSDQVAFVADGIAPPETTFAAGAPESPQSPDAPDASSAAGAPRARRRGVLRFPLHDNDSQQGQS